MVIKKDKAEISTTLLSTLNNGGVCILPCDTIYGFTGIGTEAEQRIRKIKGNEKDKKYLRLIKSPDEIYNYTSQQIDESVIRLWPGPLTIIVEAREGGTIGLRVPDDPYLQRILDKVEGPIISTSVNRGGEKPVGRIGKIIKEYEEVVDVIVDAGDYDDAIPSTVLDVTKKPYRLIREGACNIPKDFYVVS